MDLGLFGDWSGATSVLVKVVVFYFYAVLLVHRSWHCRKTGERGFTEPLPALCGSLTGVWHPWSCTSVRRASSSPLLPLARRRARCGVVRVRRAAGRPDAKDDKRWGGEDQQSRQRVQAARSTGGAPIGGAPPEPSMSGARPVANGER